MLVFIDVPIITRSTDHFFDEVNREDNNGETSEFEVGIVLFDDVLDCKQKSIGPFFIKWGHQDLDMFCLSEKYSMSPKRTKKKRLLKFFV